MIFPTRLGNVVVLNLGHGMLPVPALVLTLWPCSQKPRPCVHPVGLAQVKSFRAVLLQVSEEQENKLLPTDHAWRYLSSQVVAILDVDESNLEQGHIVMSEQSVNALKAVRLEAPKFPDSDIAGNAAKKVRKHTAFQKIHTRLRKGALATSKKKACDTGHTEDIWCLQMGRKGFEWF